MECVLCLDEFIIDLNSIDAENEYSYWQKTFKNFIE